MTDRKTAKPWFVRIKGPGRFQIKPYARQGWALIGLWGVAVYGLLALLAFPFFLERFWIPAGLSLALTAMMIVVGYRRSVPVKQLLEDQEASDRKSLDT